MLEHFDFSHQNEFHIETLLMLLSCDKSYGQNLGQTSNSIMKRNKIIQKNNNPPGGSQKPVIISIFT